MMAMRGLDQIVSGVRQMSGDTGAQTMLTTASQYATGGQEPYATIVEFSADALLDFGATAVAKRAALKATKEGIKKAAKETGEQMSKKAISKAAKAAVKSSAGKAIGKCARWQAATTIAGGLAGAGIGYQMTESWEGAFMGANFGMTLGSMVGRKLFSCFPAGTPVLTPDGPKPIEQMQPGDLVMSRHEDDDGSTAPEARRVEACFGRDGSLIDLEINGILITATPDHPFFTKASGWLEAENLAGGDSVSTADGDWLPVTKPAHNFRTGLAYNFTVEEYHTYFIGPAEHDFWIWVHNSGTCGVDPPEVLVKHRAGNTQVRHLDSRWNTPGRDLSVLPMVDELGDHIQQLANKHARGFSFKPTKIQAKKLARLRRTGRGHVANWVEARWKGQAQGRHVDTMVKRSLEKSHPHLELQSVGVDIVDPTTGLSYDLMRGSEANIHRHAMRMPDTLFRYIEFF